jgi:hypothetical protein
LIGIAIIMGQRPNQDDQSTARAAKLERALALLVEAAALVEQMGHERPSVPIEIQQLRQLAVSTTDLGMLLRSRCLDQRRQFADADIDGHQLLSVDDLLLTNQTWIVPGPTDALIASTAVFSGKSTSDEPRGRATARISSAINGVRAVSAPNWDADRRMLRFDGQVVKHFKLHAANQEAVLSAFQEENWPARIDDPLAPIETLDIKRRLNETIKSLNRSQHNRLISFRGDGTGEGIIWEPTSRLNRSSILYEI